jgi:ribosome-associated protein
MEQIKNGSAIEKRNDRLAEVWRNKIIHDKDALTELINLYPKIDRQKIRQLVQNSIKEKKESKPPKNFRQIFHLLKQHII